MKKILLSAAILLLSAGACAQNNPTSFSTDARIKKVVYRENDVVPVHGIPFTTTQIQFAKQERVLDIEGGDTTAWMVTYHPELSNMIFVKPTQFDSKTNMTVITNQRAYYFSLTCTKKQEQEPGKKTYALKFEYREPKVVHTKYATPNKPVRPKVLNTAYRFSGSPQLVPRHVFDDGKFTYFELSAQGSVPAIFAVDDQQGKESTVNTRREGKYIVVQRLAPQFTLRQGGLSASVFNTPEINRIRANRRPK
ncbi:P-type conjugative transfer protein VirB9 [Legionella pneumophila serogroup 1]|uniref:P-type conjugative transfer protein VirB9 n=1 Tax=Legionella pneumophila TaxID=446 RepID=UPI001A2B2211|nr:P-type conjugative transfer protein VirB9 [Legionella pneumophila]MCH9108498.1 P-type conjugative transfer protein VirB9 [Legionella pneumophila serogroup 1]MCH9115246.1 P-type conjugative transfer protein VirB9 [Legionella pneumophila serogroup 1]MDW8895621.1 P-type conjugative transfer protein VirB9 [Legionella pneumophila]MDW9033725.1 P-type conjugative transfer protein VirB9 [Legionella pneumophila]MDW9048711.1 P-type conjugative transfer protein VirB9 [Legionella pneumophila]